MQYCVWIQNPVDSGLESLNSVSESSGFTLDSLDLDLKSTEFRFGSSGFQIGIQWILVWIEWIRASIQRIPEWNPLDSGHKPTDSDPEMKASNPESTGFQIGTESLEPSDERSASHNESTASGTTFKFSMLTLQSQHPQTPSQPPPSSPSGLDRSGTGSAPPARRRAGCR